MECCSPCDSCHSWFTFLHGPEEGEHDGRRLCSTCNEPRKCSREIALLKQEIEQLKMQVQNQKHDFDQLAKFKLETRKHVPYKNGEGKLDVYLTNAQSAKN